MKYRTQKEDETRKHKAFPSETMGLIPNFLIFDGPRQPDANKIVPPNLPHKVPEDHEENSGSSHHRKRNIILRMETCIHTQRVGIQEK